MKKVFDAHPKAKELFVVDGIPFLKKSHALNYAKGDNDKVKVVKRGETSSDEESADKVLSDHTVPELKLMAEGLGIEGFAKMKKAELVEAIEAANVEKESAE